MYILDADTLITAKRTYFQFERVRPFWNWLAYRAGQGLIYMPIETWKKVGDKPKEQRDDLAEWVIEYKDDLVIDDRSYDTRFGDVYAQYARTDGLPHTDADIEKIGDDYAVIASALHFGYTVVTNETSETKKQGPNRKIPNVCHSLGVPCTDLDGRKGSPGLIDLLDFKVDWDK